MMAPFFRDRAVVIATMRRTQAKHAQFRTASGTFGNEDTVLCRLLKGEVCAPPAKKFLPLAPHHFGRMFVDGFGTCG